MAFDDHTNFAYSLVATAPSPATTGTTLTVTAGQGSLFPVAPFNCTVWGISTQPTYTGATATTAEVIRVTSKGTGDDWTIERLTEDVTQTARTIVVGDQIAATITDKTITDLENYAIPQVEYYRNLVPQNSVQPYTTLALTFNTLLLQPLSPVEELGFPGDMTISTWLMHMSGTGTATSAVSSSYSSTVLIGLYSLVNSTQISLVNSVSTTWARAANASNSANWAGARFLTIHSSQWSSQPVLSYRTKYWWGVIPRSSNFSNMGPSWLGQYIGASTQRSGTVGVSQTTNTSMGMVPFLGIYSASLSSMPGTLGNSQINKVHAIAGFNPGIALENVFSAF